MAPVDSGAPQGAQPSAQRMRALEPQPSAPVPAMAPVDSAAPPGAPPSARRMRALEPQQSAPVPAMAPVDLGAPQRAPPSDQRMRALEPQQSALVPAMAPVDLGGHLWRLLRARVASCDLDVMNQHGCRALCRSCTLSMGLPCPPCMIGVAACTTGKLPQNCGTGLQNDTLVGQVVVRPVLFPGGRQL